MLVERLRSLNGYRRWLFWNESIRKGFMAVGWWCDLMSGRQGIGIGFDDRGSEGNGCGGFGLYRR